VPGHHYPRDPCHTGSHRCCRRLVHLSAPRRARPVRQRRHTSGYSSGYDCFFATASCLVSTYNLHLGLKALASRNEANLSSCSNWHATHERREPGGNTNRPCPAPWLTLWSTQRQKNRLRSRFRPFLPHFRIIPVQYCL
jgi:hypothetical protein